jgi:ATP-binding cassette, subfamily B, bacterial
MSAVVASIGDGHQQGGPNPGRVHCLLAEMGACTPSLTRAGPSGGGKSTLTRLLLRCADIDDGTIAIGEQDISRVRQAAVRSQIAYVPQDPLMFHRTLRQNIAFGRLDADDAEIRKAAEAANAAEFVEGLP